MQHRSYSLANFFFVDLLCLLRLDNVALVYLINYCKLFLCHAVQFNLVWCILSFRLTIELFVLRP